MLIHPTPAVSVPTVHYDEPSHDDAAALAEVLEARWPDTLYAVVGSVLTVANFDGRAAFKVQTARAAVAERLDRPVRFDYATNGDCW